MTDARKAVPREPTPEMVIAALEAPKPVLYTGRYAEAWRAMWDAAPAAPATHNLSQQQYDMLVRDAMLWRAVLAMPDDPSADAPVGSQHPPQDAPDLSSRNRSLGAEVNAILAEHREELYEGAPQDAPTDVAALVARLNAAGHDERLSTGALYLEAAALIESQQARIAELERERDEARARAKFYVTDRDAKLDIARAERDKLRELLRSIYYRLNGAQDAVSIAIIADIAALKGEA
jgi:hypothetical protein